MPVRTANDLKTAAAEFAEPRGYLAAATMGLPPRATVAALRADLDDWNMATCDPMRYDTTVTNTRIHYARLVGIDASRVAIGSQTSVQAALFAAAAPAGAEVLCVDGDFSSIVYPFLQRDDIRVRSVPLAALADAITDETWLVSFSMVQSATGTVADAAAICEAAARHGALTFCDLTQAAGVLPVDASAFDATVCHAYKWLCAPRGVSFLTVSLKTQEIVVPTQAGWYSGDDPWTSCYGPEIHLAADARQYDVSPAWQAWVGAEPSIRLFADLDIAAVWEHAAGLGDQLSAALRLPEFHQAIVTWSDPDGRALAQLKGAGIRASGRAGRVRLAFHLWNTEEDVAAVVAALDR
ncbi:MAG TPA: aminotransferase class V-fold PLP-dependent enzyme [Galbitalea sp.]|jgi:selenocysteine lyase/cysteine desulfurase